MAASGSPSEFLIKNDDDSLEIIVQSLILHVKGCSEGIIDIDLIGCYSTFNFNQVQSLQ